jgi:hypothetical protein
MPERVNSFASLLPGVIFVFAATIAVNFDSPVRAEGTCIERPSQPAPEGTRWSAHHDRAHGRRCWSLVDANGYDVTPSQTSASDILPSLSSHLSSLLDNLTGASANVTPQATAPQATAPRKPQGNAANASKTDSSVRSDQKSVGEAHVAKRASPGLTQPEREALFEEFLRWQENREAVGGLIPLPASR